MVKKHSSQLAKAPAFRRSALALCISAISQGVWAGDVLDNTLPEGGVVRAGDASINTGGTAAAPILNIDQLSQRAIVDWAKFNVGKDATVNFNQPNANASTLNRISGGASQILGRIQAPGEVVLVNPEGMYFGKSSTVNVGALIASVNNISDEDYMAGRMIFERDGATGAIVNEGEITTALGGYIAMLAPEVRNTGVMLAQLGTIALAASDRVTLNFGPNNKLTGITAAPSTIDALIENKHAIMAPGGLIILSARGVNDIASGVIKQSGELSVGGDLQLVAKGGKILITADKVELAATSKIDASVEFDADVQQQLEADINDGGEVVINAVELNAAGAIDVSAANAGDVKVTAKTAKFEKATITAQGTGHRAQSRAVISRFLRWNRLKSSTRKYRLMLKPSPAISGCKRLKTCRLKKVRLRLQNRLAAQRQARRTHLNYPRI
jgi:filamentous hemagglutinin family protein